MEPPYSMSGSAPLACLSEGGARCGCLMLYTHFALRVPSP